MEFLSNFVYMSRFSFVALASLPLLRYMGHFICAFLSIFCISWCMI